jgi:hypothetical protein
MKEHRQREASHNMGRFVQPRICASKSKAVTDDDREYKAKKAESNG